MRILFTTLQSVESEFYGRVGAALGRHGHEVDHLTVSRHSARRLQSAGQSAQCLMDLVAALPADLDVAGERERIERRYGLPSVRDVYRSDVACRGRPEEWCVERTVRQFVAMERLFDAIAPDLLVPEVGSETFRTAAHAIALNRGVRSLFLFYTIFPDPLRLYVDTMHAPIVGAEELVAPDAEGRERYEAFATAFRAKDEPIRAHRSPPVRASRLRQLVHYGWLRVGVDGDNEYLRPARWVVDAVIESARRRAARALYRPAQGGRPFVYFPLHVVEDYKILRIIPHRADQASLVEQIADALPPGYDLVLKEHPMSIGRNRLSFLLRLRRRPNVRLVTPQTSSHRLVRDAAAVAVISSTVGLEALLYAKPVLTLGEPFYAGYGVTLDVGSTAELREAVPALLRFAPDPARVEAFMVAAMRRCRPGSPALVDRSEANAVRLAGSLAQAADELATSGAEA